MYEDKVNRSNFSLPRLLSCSGDFRGPKSSIGKCKVLGIRGITETVLLEKRVLKYAHDIFANRSWRVLKKVKVIFKAHILIAQPLESWVHFRVWLSCVTNQFSLQMGSRVLIIYFEKVQAVENSATLANTGEGKLQIQYILILFWLTMLTLLFAPLPMFTLPLLFSSFRLSSFSSLART